MHILLIHQYYQEKDDPGGLRWNSMTRLWSEQGHQITVIAGMTNYASGIKHPKYKNKYTYTEEFAKNIRVIRTHVSASYNKHFRGRLNAYFSFVWSGIYGGLFKARDTYDIILVSSPPLSVGIIALVLSFFKRKPYILEVRDLWPESAIDTGVLTNKTMIKWSYKLEALLYRKAIAVNVVTPAMRDILAGKKNVSASKLIYIPNAADFDLTDQISDHTDINTIRTTLQLENKLAICYVGAHGVANHLEQIIEAANLLKHEPVQFILIGDGMQKNNLIKLVEEKQLANVSFIGLVPKAEALKYIKACDIGLSVLKKAETFKTVYSNKTFDYMACKKPVIMAIDGVSRKLIEDAKAGVFTEPEQPQAMADAVSMYLQNKHLIKEHGENGYQYVRQHFDRKVLAEQYLQEIITRANQ